MSTDKLFLDRLLMFQEALVLYQSLGDTIRTDIDVRNSPYDLQATANTIRLLMRVGLLVSDEDAYKKAYSLEGVTREGFRVELLSRICKTYAEQVRNIFSGDALYDEKLASFYIKRNLISLDLSGLLMLLGDLGAVDISGDNIYVRDASLLGERDSQSRRVSIVDLKQGLVVKEHLGAEAEELALAFEKTILKEQQIYNKVPMIISGVDASAGYDIVSFLSQNSITPDKFIEVKSCADNQYHFYISKNEIEVARNKGDSYFLYLYNRQNQNFIIVKNPYENVIQSNIWAKTTQITEIHRI